MLQNFINPKDPIFLFSVLLFIILVFPVLFGKFKLPSLIGLIVAGIIVGPNAFGVVEKTLAIDILSKIGLLYIMFLAGLEIDLFQIKNKINDTIVFGIATFLIPLVMGILVGFYILKLNMVTSVLLASMFSSHTLLTYPIVSKLGLVKNNGVISTIGGTIITNVLALLILAVIAGSAKNSSGIVYWIKFISLLAGYTLVVIFLIPKIGKMFFKTRKKDDSLEFIFVLFMVLLCSYLAYLSGLEPIIGAFLAGFIFNPLIPQNSVLMNRINFIGNSLFIPIFLISVGMLVDIKVLFSDVKTWIVSISMVAVAIVSKLLASFISQKILKWKKFESGISFGMSVNQAAATLAAVLVGYELKFFDESILTGTIMMISVTCFLGPIITDYYGKKLALSQESQNQEDVLKNLRIFVPLHNKNNIKDLMELAFVLYKKYSTESIYPANVVLDSFDTEERLLEAEKLLSFAVNESVAANINVTPVTRVDQNISNGILKATRDLRVNCIISGWDGDKSSITKIFGYVLDPIIENSSQLVIINKIVHSFRSYNRIILVIPPMIERQRGYEEAFGVIKNIAEQLQTSMVLVTSEETVKTNSKIINKIKNTFLQSIVRVQSWKSITDILDEQIKESDIIILLSARITKPAWQPMLNKLPGIISKRYTKNNVMIIFPSEEKVNSQFLTSDEQSMDFLYKIINRENIYFNIHKNHISDVFKVIFAKRFRHDKKTYKYLVTTLTDLYHNEPIQVLEDVVFIHIHLKEIKEFIIYVVTDKNGFAIPNLQNKVKTIIILLNSTERSHESHLYLLKDIASTVRTEGLLEALTTSNNIKEFENNFTNFNSTK